MTDTPALNHQRHRIAITIVACAVALLAVAVGYALLARGGPQTVPQAELAATLDTYATLSADAIGTRTPRRGGNPQPCTNGDGTDDTAGNRYQLIGIYSLTYPDPTPDPAVERVRTEWQQRGYDVGEPRYLDDGRFADLYAYDQDNEIGLFLDPGAEPDTFTLVVTSPCVHAPSDESPN